MDTALDTCCKGSGQGTDVFAFLESKVCAAPIFSLRPLLQHDVRFLPVLLDRGFLPARVRPLEEKVHNRAGLGDGFGKRESRSEHGPLPLRIVRGPRLISQRIVEKGRPRWADEFRDVSRAGERDGGQTLPFQNPGDQSHGLVTRRSEGHVQDNIGPGGLGLDSHSRSHLRDQVPQPFNRSEHTQVVLGDIAEEAFRG